MTAWLDPVRASLDARAAPIAFFVRDDDGGWNDEALLALLDTVERRSVPIDLALIPDACEAPLAQRLRDRDGKAVHLHQHGRLHINHERTGRKCEFGTSRSADQQRDDIAAGRRRLRDLVGDRLEPIFTPPWNRCTAATVQCLLDLDFELLSRDVTAATGAEAIAELPVTLDWTGRRGASAGAVGWGIAIAGSIRASRRPIGLMLHHAVMSERDREMLGALLDLLTSHDAVRFASMLEVARARGGAE
jgi:hypothetical protein